MATAEDFPIALATKPLPVITPFSLSDYTIPIVSYLQRRQCLWCGVIFTPKSTATAKLSRFCGRSCSAKWRMRQPEIRAGIYTEERKIKQKEKFRAFMAQEGSREKLSHAAKERESSYSKEHKEKVAAKVSASLRLLGCKPTLRGGNGSGPTLPQKLLFEALEGEWKLELVVITQGTALGYPSCYKIDIGDEARKIGIEVDGESHRSNKIRQKDIKKAAFLAGRGWKIIRIKNNEILTWEMEGRKGTHVVSILLTKLGIVYRRKNE